MYKLVVAGSREFNDYPLLETILLQILVNHELSEVEIVSGNARGADKLGEVFARKHGCQLKQFIPNWSEDGRGAGMIRNRQMSQYADGCIVFWDGLSKGTVNMIENAKKEDLDLRVINYNERD